MHHLLTCLFTAGLVALISPAGKSDDLQEVRFTGSLHQPDRSGESLILRKFEVVVLNSASQNFFSIVEEDRDGSPWPESFGQLQTAKEPGPHLVYKYEGSAYTLPLPPLQLEFPDEAMKGSSWKAGDWTFDIVDAASVNDQRVWKIDARERRGRRQQLTAATNSGLLMSAKQDVFMGQGKQFELTIDQVSTTAVEEKAAAQTKQLISKLIALQSSMARRSDSQQTELSPRQIEAATSQVDNLTALAKGTALQETVLHISRDAARQNRRIAGAMKRQEELINTAAPEFVLNLVSKGTLESESLKGKTVILHFWQYADKPLSEPYGQVAYLEFLFNKRKQTNVEVVGISMNPSLHQQETLRQAIRSARKLTEFMNLSYPIGYDDGSLLQAFGDPRPAGGQLPVWVVISPAGKVVHYHSGFYEVDVREGLKQLDAVVTAQSQRATK